MNVELTPQQEAELAKLAESKGRNVGQLAQDVIDYYLQHEARFIEAISGGLQSLDEGKSISHEEVGKRLERILQS